MGVTFVFLPETKDVMHGSVDLEGLGDFQEFAPKPRNSAVPNGMMPERQRKVCGCGNLPDTYYV